VNSLPTVSTGTEVKEPRVNEAKQKYVLLLLLMTMTKSGKL
jgi:hypothetical protein